MLTFLYRQVWDGNLITMANIGRVFSIFGKGVGGIFGKLLKIKLSYYFVIILFIQAVVLGFQNGGGWQIVISLGERFFNMFQSLHEVSLQVIESGGVFTWWGFVVVVWEMFSNLFMIYLWIKLLFKGYEKSIVSNASNDGINLIFAVFTFYILQIFYLLFMKYELGVDFLSSYGFFGILKIPVDAFIDLSRAIILLLTSLQFEKNILPIIDSNVSNSCMGEVCTI